MLNSDLLVRFSCKRFEGKSLLSTQLNDLLMLSASNATKAI